MFEPWRKYIIVENLFPWKLNVKMKSWALGGAFHPLFDGMPRFEKKNMMRLLVLLSIRSELLVNLN
jgi:hypothetical protein